GGQAAFPDATTDPSYVDSSGQVQPDNANAAPPLLGGGARVGDPVNIADAAFEIETTDLSVGQREPRGMSLGRFYSSRRRNSNPAGMAPGWVHSYYLKATEVGAPDAGLGGATPAQMAPMLVASCA